MKPVAEQRILVTGSTDGLGRRVAEDVAGQGADVIARRRLWELSERLTA